MTTLVPFAVFLLFITRNVFVTFISAAIDVVVFPLVYILYYAAKDFRFNTIVFSHDLVIFDTLRSQAVTLPRERAKSMLCAAGKLLLEGCSTEGLPLLIRYLKQTVKESETAGESVGDGATGRLALVQGVVDALEIVQNHHITEMLKAEMEQLPKIEGML